MAENSFQEYNLIATLAGILAGFSLAGVIDLLEHRPDRKLATVSSIVFSIATLLFVYSLFTFVLLSVAVLWTTPDKLDPIAASAFITAVIGIIFFLTGIALVGWLRSRVAGIIATLGVLITTCSLLTTLMTIIMALPPKP